MRHKLSKDGLIGNVDKMLKCLTLQNSMDLWQFMETISCSWQNSFQMVREGLILQGGEHCFFFVFPPSSRKTLKHMWGRGGWARGRMLCKACANLVLWWDLWALRHTSRAGIALSLPEFPVPKCHFALKNALPAAPRFLWAGFPPSSPSQSPSSPPRPSSPAQVVK